MDLRRFLLLMSIEFLSIPTELGFHIQFSFLPIFHCYATGVNIRNPCFDKMPSGM